MNNRSSKEKKENGNGSDADFFRVSAWRKLGENCAKYVKRGMKVAVVGPVSLHKYTNSKGEANASMEVNADDVEFLTRVEGNASDDEPQYEPQEAPQNEEPQGFTPVEFEDQLPF